MNGVCKKHQKEPVTIYGKCVGCEIVYYQTKNSELMTQIRGEIEVSEQVVQEREELILENERLQKALEFYADEENYTKFPYRGDSLISMDISEPWKHARKALKEGETQ